MYIYCKKWYTDLQMSNTLCPFKVLLATVSTTSFIVKHFYSCPKSAFMYYVCFSAYIVSCSVFVRSFSLYPFLWQFHSLFHSEFSTEWDVVLPLSVYNIISFPQSHPIAAYIFFLSLLSFSLFFLQQRVLEGSYFARCKQWS